MLQPGFLGKGHLEGQPYFYQNLILKFLVNWYATRFPFPKRGLKYFLWLIRKAGTGSASFHKRIHTGQLMVLHPSEHVQRQIFWYGYYEKIQLKVFEQFLRQDAVFADIGANIGYYSIVAASQIKQGSILAFEPAREIRKQLEKNIEINRIPNIKILPFALSDHDGQKTFFLSSCENLGMSGLSESEITSAAVPVQVRSFDSWAEESGLRQIDLIKMDIEGAEFHALEGMVKTLKNVRPVIFIEVQDLLLRRHGSDSGRLFQLLQGLHYFAYRILSENEVKKENSAFEDELVLFVPAEKQLPASLKVLNA